MNGLLLFGFVLTWLLLVFLMTRMFGLMAALLVMFSLGLELVGVVFLLIGLVTVGFKGGGGIWYFFPAS